MRCSGRAIRVSPHKPDNCYAGIIGCSIGCHWMVFLCCFWINGQTIREWRGTATTWLNDSKMIRKKDDVITLGVQEMSFNLPYPGLVRRSKQVDGISIISSGGYGWFSVVGRSYLCRIFPNKPDILD